MFYSETETLLKLNIKGSTDVCVCVCVGFVSSTNFQHFMKLAISRYFSLEYFQRNKQSWAKQVVKREFAHACFRFLLSSIITRCSWRSYVKNWILGSLSRRLAMFSSTWYVSLSPCRFIQRKHSLIVSLSPIKITFHPRTFFFKYLSQISEPSNEMSNFNKNNSFNCALNAIVKWKDIRLINKKGIVSCRWRTRKELSNLNQNLHLFHYVLHSFLFFALRSTSLNLVIIKTSRRENVYSIFYFSLQKLPRNVQVSLRKKEKWVS